jgi:hypothetical protein
MSETTMSGFSVIKGKAALKKAGRKELLTSPLPQLPTA